MNQSSAVAKRGNHEIPQQHQQTSASILDKIIDELSSKLVQLSGEDLEIEVNIRIKFPKKKSNRRRSISKCPTNIATKECSSHQPLQQQQSQKQQEQQKDDKQGSKTKKVAASTNINNPAHKLRDFAFDIESYAKVDPREADKSAHIPREVAEAVAREKIAAVAYRKREKAAEAAAAAAAVTDKSSHQMPLANAVQRAPSPDIVTMGSMFDDDSEVQSYDGTTDVTLSESSHYSEYPEPLSSPTTSLQTSKLFPKAHVHYAKKKN